MIYKFPNLMGKDPLDPNIFDVGKDLLIFSFGGNLTLTKGCKFSEHLLR